jgi:prepilin-type N-terminal cleavage/methylation domain-containing protein
MSPGKQAAFTLVELLVVITIIVALLSLLAPALDKAIYEAELAVCASQQRAVAQGLTAYAAGHSRLYPLRTPVHAPQFLSMGTLARTASLEAFLAPPTEGVDARQFLEGFVLLDLLIDPLSEKVDLSRDASDPDAVIITSRALWYGWQFPGHDGMKRLGDRWSWRGDDILGNRVNHRFSYLTTDSDRHNATGNVVYGSHPDADGLMTNLVMQNETFEEGPAVVGYAVKWTDSEWWRRDGVERGAIDMNFASADGSVDRLREVLWQGDERVVRVPIPCGWPMNFHRLKPE